MHRRRLLLVAQKWPRLRQGLPSGPHALPAGRAQVTQWFHALSEDTRVAILEFLSGRDRCVRDLQDVIEVPQSTLSFHLKVLKQSGLVRETRHGRRKYFAIRGETMELMIEWVQRLMPGKHTGTCMLSCCR